MKKKKVMFISSMGGHLSEMLQLDSLFDNYDYCVVTEKTNSTKKLRNKYKKVYYLTPGTRTKLFTYIFKFGYNTIKSFIYYLMFRPEIIVSTGTHSCVPMFYIGKLFGSKIIYIESFANFETRTLTGKIVYRLVDKIYVQWETMLEKYPNAEFIGRVY